MGTSRNNIAQFEQNTIFSVKCYNSVMPHWLLLTISILLMLPGLGLVFIPMVPAIAYMFVIALCFALVDGLVNISSFNLWILGSVVVISILIDQLSGIVGAKYGGASRKAILFGFIGAIIGLFTIPFFGALVGLFAGVLLAELFLNKSRSDAVRAATGALIGSATGIAVNFCLALLFIILFTAFAF